MRPRFARPFARLLFSRFFVRGPVRRAPFRVLAVFAGALSVSLAGCHSRFVEATIDNTGSSPLHLVEVDYPSASFGAQTIGAHAQYHYRFKILGSGSVKLSFTDDRGTPHTATGPELDEGQEGGLSIAIDDAALVHWAPHLRSPE